MQERSPSVFVVDDDEAVRSSLRLLVKSVGLIPTALGSAREFLEKYDPAQSPHSSGIRFKTASRY